MSRVWGWIDQEVELEGVVKVVAAVADPGEEAMDSGSVVMAGVLERQV